MSENRQSDSTFILTHVELECRTEIVPGRLKDIIAGLERQARSDTDALNTMQDRLHELHPHYREYIELVGKLRQTEERASATLGMLWGVKSPNIAEIVDSYNELEAAGSTTITPVSELPIWKAIREMLRHVPEMQVIDIERMMKELGVQTGRTAIDSAIATHKNIFTVRKRGRDKFISLKGE
jgi:hypothetical protein